MKTTKDYHNLCLKYDADADADIFENLRHNSLKNHGLCLSHYLCAPASSLVRIKWLIWQKLSLNLFQIMTCICSSKKVWEAGSLTFLRHIVKPAISI